MPEIGSQAPTFTLPNTNKELVSLESFRDKSAVVVAFFPAAFTGTCQKELCTFRDRISEFNEVDAQVLGVSVDPIFSQKAFAAQNELNFPLLSDFARVATKAYGVGIQDFATEGYVAAQRSVFVVDRSGVLRFAWVADKPSTEPNYDDVKAAVAALTG
jgi:peroxiredoxin